MNESYVPLDDALFRNLLAGLIDGAHKVEQEKTLYEAQPFSVVALQLCKKLFLTRSCELVSELLERNL